MKRRGRDINTENKEQGIVEEKEKVRKAERERERERDKGGEG